MVEPVVSHIKPIGGAARSNQRQLGDNFEANWSNIGKKDKNERRRLASNQEFPPGQVSCH